MHRSVAWIRIRIRGAYLLGAAIAAGWAAPSHAIRTDPAKTEVGDRGSIVFPISNDPESSGPLQAVRVSLENAPSWLDVQDTSVLGPQDILPGQTFSFELDFVVGPSFSDANKKVGMQVRITQASGDSLPSSWLWTYSSADGFFSFSARCVDDAGRSCGSARSPDSTPPATTYRIVGNQFIAGERVFVGPAAKIELSAEDLAAPGEPASGREFTVYSVNQPASSIDDLPNLFFEPIALPEQGEEHLIRFASMDDNLQTESVRILKVTVDRASPPAPLSLLASAVYPLTWQHPPEVPRIIRKSFPLGYLRWNSHFRRIRHAVL